MIAWATESLQRYARSLGGKGKAQSVTIKRQKPHRHGADETSNLAPPPPKPVLWLICQRSNPSNQSFAVGQTAMEAYISANVKDKDGIPLDFASVSLSIVPDDALDKARQKALEARGEEKRPKKRKK